MVSQLASVLEKCDLLFNRTHFTSIALTFIDHKSSENAAGSISAQRYRQVLKEGFFSSMQVPQSIP